jgi:hypothetical protein
LLANEEKSTDNTIRDQITATLSFHVTVPPPESNAAKDFSDKIGKQSTKKIALKPPTIKYLKFCLLT